MLETNLIHDVLTEALSTGGDFAEIFVENTVRNSINAVNGICEKSVSGVDYGAGLRIFTGFNAIYVYTNDTSRENFLKIAKEAAAAVAANKNARGVVGYKNPSSACSMGRVYSHGFAEASTDGAVKKEIAEILKYAHSVSKNESPLITQTSASYADTVTTVMLANSDGLTAKNVLKRTRAAFSCVAGNETEKQTASYGPGASLGHEFIKSLDIAEIAKNISETAVTMLKAKKAPGGKMPVVIDNGFGGVIFHEACGHSLEATSVAKGASVFCGKLGEKIASECVTAIDDGTLPNAYGSIFIDDEGEICRRNILIENGILKSYMIDRLNGLKMGMPPTGSSRRESYKYAPTSRMTNTFIAAGKSTKNDIISSTDYGLYAKKMGGGSVVPATGEFNFAVVEGYMIRHGKIAEAVRGATLIGKGSETLLNIDMVSDNPVLEQGICGSASGSVPVSVGQPMIRVKELTVGGTANGTAGGKG